MTRWRSYLLTGVPQPSPRKLSARPVQRLCRCSAAGQRLAPGRQHAGTWSASFGANELDGFIDSNHAAALIASPRGDFSVAEDDSEEEVKGDEGDEEEDARRS